MATSFKDTFIRLISSGNNNLKSIQSNALFLILHLGHNLLLNTFPCKKDK